MVKVKLGRQAMLGKKAKPGKAGQQEWSSLVDPFEQMTRSGVGGAGVPML